MQKLILSFLAMLILAACSTHDKDEEQVAQSNNEAISETVASVEKQLDNKDESKTVASVDNTATSHAHEQAKSSDEVVKKAQEVIDTIAKANAKGVDLSNPDDYDPNIKYGSLWDSELFSEDRFMLKVKLTESEKKEAKILARSFEAHMQRGTIFMYHLLSELKKRNLPVELAAIPLVESGFKTRARSHANAHGPWQFTRRTGKSFGLKVSNGYDEFYDFVITTNASLNYLEHLYKQFNNWDLALIAYNQGEFGVKKAIRRAKANGVKNISASTISLSRTARTYLSRIRAYSDILKNPSTYKVECPKIEYRVAFKRVDTKGFKSLSDIAKASGVDLKLLKHINAGFLTDSLKNNKYGVLIPVENLAQFEKAFTQRNQITLEDGKKVAINN